MEFRTVTSTVTASRYVEWDAGHRVLGHEGKCAHAHGHRYKALITVEASKLDEVGRVVDFSVIKRVFQTWVDAHWDHKFICNVNDAAMIAALSSVDPHGVAIIPVNPTAENLAQILATLPEADEALTLAGVCVVSVVVWETPNCCATYTVEEV